MGRLPDDLQLNDPVNGPEFSIRTMNALRNEGIETIGQLREAVDNNQLRRVPGLGVKRRKEITDYIIRNDVDEPLFETPEYLRYRLEDNLTTTQALLHDVQSHLMRAALKGGASLDVRNQLRIKLIDAAERVTRIPTYEGD